MFTARYGLDVKYSQFELNSFLKGLNVGSNVQSVEETFRDMSTLKYAVRIVTIVCDGCARSKKYELMLVKVYLWEFCDFHNDCAL